MALTEVDAARLNDNVFNTVGPFKNRIINGDMRIDQRNAGASVTPSSAAISYCVDRFYTAAGSTVTGTLSVQRTATGVPGESQFCLRIARTSGTYAGSIYVGQTIETANCYDLAGKTITVSFRARKGSAYSASTIGVSCYTGTAADQGSASGVAGTWTGWTSAGSVTFTPTASFATYSTNFSIGASVQEIQINLTTGNFSGTGGANDYIEITDVQLEAGSVATPFERRSYGQELALCQRYYEKSYDQSVAPGTATTNGLQFCTVIVSSGNINGSVFFKVNKRAAPTMTYYDSAGTSSRASYAFTSNNWGTAVPISGSASSETGATVQTTGAGFGTCPVFIHHTASAEL